MESLDIREVVSTARLQELHFCTDGSCSNPSCVPAAHAGWVVILDLKPTAQPSELIALKKAHRQPPYDFVVVVKAAGHQALFHWSGRHEGG